MSVLKMPRILQNKRGPVTTDDPRLSAIIEVQEVLSRFQSVQEREFVLETVMRNLALNMQLIGDRVYRFEE